MFIKRQLKVNETGNRANSKIKIYDVFLLNQNPIRTPKFVKFIPGQDLSLQPVELC